MMSTKLVSHSSDELASLLDGRFGHLEGQVHRATCRDWHKAQSVAVGNREYLILYRQTVSDTHLTPRERAAVRLAMGGATNKEIAWALEVTASTVGVFMWRAARKLAVTTRDELFRAFVERYPHDRAMGIDEWPRAHKLDEA